MSRFEVLVLGNSSAVPAYGRHPSSQLINIHEHFILIDCGEGTQERLLQYQAKPHKIEHIFISHLHGDHYFGLPGLVTSMNLSGRKDKLHIYSPSGLQELMQFIMDLASSALNFEIQWTILSGDESQIILEDTVKKIISFPLNHRVPTYGFLINEKPGKRVFNAEKFHGELPGYEKIRLLKDGEDVIANDGAILRSVDYTSPALPPKSYAYCSDTVYDEKIISYIQGTDLLYHEATYSDSHKTKAIENFHSTAAEAAQIANRSQVKRLMIGHFSSRYKSPDILLSEAQKVFNNTILSEEGKWYKV